MTGILYLLLGQHPVTHRCTDRHKDTHTDTKTDRQTGVRVGGTQDSRRSRKQRDGDRNPLSPLGQHPVTHRRTDRHKDRQTDRGEGGGYTELETELGVTRR